MKDDVSIRKELRPGDLGRILLLHGQWYEEESGHFGLPFEAYVAKTLAEFVLENGAKGTVFLAERGDEPVGCAALVDRGEAGQLRWVLVAPPARGAALGRRLVEAALEQARADGKKRVFLETTTGLDASMAIYRSLGFKIVREETVPLWSGPQTMIVMEKMLG
ncbi:GNAT family N-acetyltransferase [Amphiplicatus metriothermophilus]|uniref:Acetyltransferase (GNAT) family protein n=1 Tax=Amphiplicatus metriothermophilus TaxID=1519374 RepID=A0A239PSV6_9PROT|nr:GNAT family N-acetyltransferase [Amphiplicatus metriothermophilus]MBB5519295.1 GNAT superfamily N-acetyltransferase [Amphiplicatus metriothermophilus]SNT73364.1 Acetyltransferase (GNAT) family protein [Amphiplicatus metriothermophilus]